jgi:Holliday junction resolvase RusA-like endonuclease
VTALSFHVAGTPQPQGSKRHVGNGRMIESAKGLKPWRAKVTAAALTARRPHDPIVGPVAVTLAFTFPRPKFHYGTGRNAGVVKAQYADALMVTKPDIDKLERAVLDALSGVVFVDDCQVVASTKTKSYGEPGVTVTVTEIKERAA